MKDSVRGYVPLLVLGIVSLIVMGGSACSTPRPEKDVKNPDPSGKIPAYKQAVREKDRSATVQMVKDLDSDDPAVRLFAIVGLRRLTGETFGYQYFDDAHQRRPAVKRWTQWLAGDQPEQTTEDAVVNDGATDAPSGAPNGASAP